MKKILIPTDFSADALNALHYAEQLGHQLGAMLEVLHIYHPSADPYNPYQTTVTQVLEKVKEEQLEHFIAKRRLTGDDAPALEGRMEIGFPSELIVTQSNGFDLVVMSTLAEGGFLRQVFGSISVYVAQRAHCPVLLVPPEAKFEESKRMLFATDWQSADADMVERALHFIQWPLEGVDFVHVHTERNAAYEVRQTGYEQHSVTGHPALGFKFITITSNTVWEGLERYAADNPIGWMILGTQHREFLERLFYQSTTKQVAFHTHSPLLILHYQQ